MASIFDWSLVSADNANADSDLTWAEGQAPGTVNASARTMMARVAELLADMGGTITATGSANTILVTANSAFTAYADGRMVSFKAAEDNTGAATLNVNSIGAKSLRRASASGDAALVAGNIQAGCIYVAIYNTSLNSGAGGWALINETISLVDYVTLTGTETLTNKTLASPAFTGTPTGLDATTTARGLVELATDAEAQTGTDTERAITSANLQAVTATTTRKGVAELATDAEAQAGTDTARVVTPDNLGATVLGMGQAWQDMSASRTHSTSYQNTTGRSIMIAIRATGSFRSLQASPDNSSWADICAVGGDSNAQISPVIPPGHYYRINGSTTVVTWTELR
jgi:hypothetical protein